jgi:Ala-tRNA(Pro) deacylase
MGQEEVETIKKFFLDSGITPNYLEHEAVVTSEEAARTRGFELKQGIKAILFTNDNNEWVIADIPADKKADLKKVATQMNWSKSRIRMATAEEVMEKTGCELGAVPPLGHRQNLPIVVDNSVYNNQESAFNIGLKTRSIKLKTEYLKPIFNKIGAIEGNFTKE